MGSSQSMRHTDFDRVKMDSSMDPGSTNEGPATTSLTTNKRSLTEDVADSEIYPMQKRRMATKECTTCCNDVSINKFPKLPHATAKTHDRSLCMDCWIVHLKLEITSKGWDAVSCPLCEGILTWSEIKKIVPKKTYGDWLDKAARACCESDEEYHSCPRAECDWACFISTKEDGNIFTCQKCKYRYCILCEAPMHEEQTCEQYQEVKKRLQEENAASEQFVAEDTKPCPNCHRPIHKIGGCNHFTCEICKHEFCWLCFAPYGSGEGIWLQGNSVHRATCPYYPTRLPNS